MARKYWGRTRLVSLPKVRCILPDHIYAVAASQAPVVQRQCECANHEQENIHAQEKHPQAVQRVLPQLISMCMWVHSDIVIPKTCF